MPDGIIHPGQHDGDLIRYLDAFRPPLQMCNESLRSVGEDIIPPLLGALQAIGLSLFVTHSLKYLARVCGKSGGEMHLAKINDPHFHPNAGRADTCVMLLARDAELVGCIGSRLIWCEETLADEMESGRFWVADPATMWSSKDRCITNSETARSISSCPVVYSGSVYLDPSVRGGIALAALCRLHLLWLAFHWRWAWLVGVVHGGLLHNHVFDIYGVEFVEQAIWLTRDDDNELHRYQLAFNRKRTSVKAWLRPEMADLSRPMGLPPRSILRTEAPKEIRGSKRPSTQKR